MLSESNQFHGLSESYFELFTSLLKDLPCRMECFNLEESVKQQNIRHVQV